MLKNLNKTKIINIVSILEAPKEMAPQEAKDYCDHIAIAGRCTCIPTRKVLRTLLKNIVTVNKIIRDLNGDELESKWYMASNDTFTSSPGFHPDDNLMLGISLEHLDDYAGKGGKICWTIGPDTKVAFYPAVKI